MLVPREDIARVARAHGRLLDTIGGFGDQAVRRPSLLPGWTVAHVLTHVARNADSHVRRATAAATGEMVEQYEGGLEGRAAEIEKGAACSATDIVEDVRRSARAVEVSWRDLAPAAWTSKSRDVGGMERPLFELPSRRWQEVEVHLVDLDVGISHREWPDDFVLEWLPRTRERMRRHLPPEVAGVRFDHPADELAWFYGRFRREDLPELPPWG
ncbi:MAG: maleylpyruvate isomerase N-terminal domain-containing protein [Acidimicrobiales bacterium]